MFPFSCVLRKLEPSYEFGSVCAAIFRKATEIKWPLLALSSLSYRASFAGIMCTRRCGTPILERLSCASIRNRTNSNLKRTTN